MANKIIRESWIEGRLSENEDFVIEEVTDKANYRFSLPWYASTVPHDHDVFFPLENRLGKHWYDGYSPAREEMRLSTMNEF